MKNRTEFIDQIFKYMLYALLILTTITILMTSCSAHYCPTYSGFDYNYKIVKAKKYYMKKSNPFRKNKMR